MSSAEAIESTPPSRRRTAVAPELTAVSGTTPSSDEVARALIDYVSSGQIGPGEKLPSERQLSESFGVGRGIIREGIKSLGVLGLVEFRHGGGTYLRQGESDLLPRVIEWGLMLGERRASDLVEARRYLEQITTLLAAERSDDAHLAQIETALHAMRAATSTDEFVEADVAFHLAIAEASGNLVLANMLKSISSLLRVWIHRVMDAAESFEESYQEHVPVFEAIRVRDSAAAAAAMESHMARASRRLTETLHDAGQ
ncbi:MULTISPECIES: FadR/GntR family transcriptional regulator [unclassified Curtobacterium]|uniref:FadR/GntR family transcriptional regulator n=1 Tax=unclassified Curtobacterium TaxID=257496 RepID=UPI001C65405A|nr:MULTISPECIES: FadR/GntR family transcriptional regulator [unclassified Curtobacterium]WIE79178.1 FadR/GntR family transcriptional regulator [Curtobacterium sp. MCSS17_016]